LRATSLTPGPTTAIVSCSRDNTTTRCSSVADAKRFSDGDAAGPAPAGKGTEHRWINGRAWVYFGVHCHPSAPAICAAIWKWPSGHCRPGRRSCRYPHHRAVSQQAAPSTHQPIPPLSQPRSYGSGPQTTDCRGGPPASGLRTQNPRRKSQQSTMRNGQNLRYLGAAVRYSTCAMPVGFSQHGTWNAGTGTGWLCLAQRDLAPREGAPSLSTSCKTWSN
jgi:hypothetical protein